MSAPASRLTPFQREVLGAFFERAKGFYLTGGAALAGFHLGHRETHDLDLFTLVGPLTDGVEALHDLGRAIRARCEEVRTAPEFRRFVLSREDDSVVVDLVVERAPQLVADKPWVGSIQIDPPEEILANSSAPCWDAPRSGTSWTCMPSSSPGCLETGARGRPAEGRRPDPGQLAWVLSRSRSARGLASRRATAPELRRYLQGLIDRLVSLARP